MTKIKKIRKKEFLNNIKYERVRINSFLNAYVYYTYELQLREVPAV